MPERKRFFSLMSSLRGTVSITRKEQRLSKPQQTLAVFFAKSINATNYFIDVNLISKHLKGQLGPQVCDVTLFAPKKVSWGPASVTSCFFSLLRTHQNVPAWLYPCPTILLGLAVHRAEIECFILQCSLWPLVTPCRLTIGTVFVIFATFWGRNQRISTSQRKGCHLLEGFFLVGTPPTGRLAGWGQTSRYKSWDIVLRTFVIGALFSSPPGQTE